MCRTVHAVLQTLICGVQMLVRVLMTVLLMIENLIRMILQTLYNFISFMLQLLSLIPICVVFLVSARLKCFMCGGGGGCQPGRGGACDCIMSLVAIVILFFIFKSTGVMDKIFYSMGYAKAVYESEPYVPTPGDITECSRNDTDQDIEYLVSTETYTATTAANYLNKLVEGYIETIVTQNNLVETPEPEEIDVSFTTKGVMTILTVPVTEVVNSLITMASDLETTTVITEIFKPTVIDTTGVVYTTAPETAAVVTIKTANTEAFETIKIGTTQFDHTTGFEASELGTGEADETVTDVAEIVTVDTVDATTPDSTKIFTTEAVDATLTIETIKVTMTLENIVDQITTQVTEAIEDVYQ